MSTGKAKVIVKVGNDFFRIAENILKMFKGSKDVVKSSATAAKREGRTIRNASQSTIKDKAQLNKLNRAHKADVARGGLKTAGERTKNIDLKSHPSLKNGIPKPKTKISSTTRKSPWSTTKPKTKTTPEPPKITQAQRLRDADVTKGTKINLKNATVGQNVYKAGKKAGNVVREGGKKFIKTNKGKLIALTAATAGVGGYYIGKKIDQSIAGTNGEATTSSGAATTTKPKPPKQPLGPPSVYPPTKKPPTTRVADDDLEAKAPKADPKVAAKLAKPKTFEQKLKAKFVKFRGGEPAFGKKGSDAAWKTEVLNMREGSEGGYTYTDQQNYDKIIAERKELASATKKKRGGVIKRNKGGPVRGVGKALRGYGNNSIYSNKMY